MCVIKNQCYFFFFLNNLHWVGPFKRHLSERPYLKKATNNLFLNQVGQKFQDAIRAMGNTLKQPNVWRPCLYLCLSNALSLNIYDGMFYWYTDSEAGPHFSQV